MYRRWKHTLGYVRWLECMTQFPMPNSDGAGRSILESRMGLHALSRPDSSRSHEIVTCTGHFVQLYSWFHFLSLCPLLLILHDDTSSYAAGGVRITIHAPQPHGHNMSCAPLHQSTCCCLISSSGSPLHHPFMTWRSCCRPHVRVLIQLCQVALRQVSRVSSNFGMQAASHQQAEHHSPMIPVTASYFNSIYTSADSRFVPSIHLWEREMRDRLP